MLDTNQPVARHKESIAMRTRFARRSIYAALVGLVAAGAVAVAQNKFSVRAMMNTGKPAANLPVFLDLGGQETPLGTTNANGDFELAMDANKNGKEFAIYRENCSRLVIRARDPQREEECRRQSEQEKDKECKTCELVGLFIWGQGGGGGGIGPKGWAALSAGTLLGVVAGMKAGGNATPASPSAAAPPLTSAAGTFQASMMLQSATGPCASFTNPAVIRLVIPTVNAADGSFSYQVIHVLVGVTFSATGVVTAQAGGGFRFRLNSAQTGTLTQSGEGTINAQGTEATGTFVVTTPGGPCAYGPTVMPRVG